MASQLSPVLLENGSTLELTEDCHVIHFRVCHVSCNMEIELELGPEDVSLLERYPF